ncbi:MAG: RpiB/LacA/LacB family sugar-phosphate isomerase [Candidatus Daviesbacteria bacterium]|nr:RpiB/LacA/LacB family sugar-phosphate isomerase [Candidatus Daviesbacteria bacterium]
MIYLGADHRGYDLKSRIFKWLEDEGYEVTDLGNDHLDPDDDYVDFAQKVAGAVAGGSDNIGILFCGSGAGVDIVANKFDGIRSALVFDLARAKQAREDDDANIISLPADILDEEKALEIVKVFLETKFSEEERHQRRLQKLQKIEENN